MSFAALAPRHSVNTPTISSARCLTSAIARSPKSTAPARSIRRGSRRPSTQPVILECKGRRFPAAFFVLECQHPDSLLHCKRQIAAMQTNLLLLVSGIHKVSPYHESGASSLLQKGDIHVQDCIHRPPALPNPVRSPDSFHRPSADREQPHCGSQRRPPPFRPLMLLQ